MGDPPDRPTGREVLSLRKPVAARCVWAPKRRESAPRRTMGTLTLQALGLTRRSGRRYPLRSRPCGTPQEGAPAEAPSHCWIPGNDRSATYLLQLAALALPNFALRADGPRHAATGIMFTRVSHSACPTGRVCGSVRARIQSSIISSQHSIFVVVL